MTRGVRAGGAAVLLLAALVAQAEAGDPARGERLFQYCFSCHSVEPGAAALEGPNLRGVVGRRVAAEAGFAYSPAMRAFAEREARWSEALLDRYLAAPYELVPKTSMAFPGIAAVEERADLIAYLRLAGDGAR